jgi:hypothetical protein
VIAHFQPGKMVVGLNLPGLYIYVQGSLSGQVLPGRNWRADPSRYVYIYGLFDMSRPDRQDMVVGLTMPYTYT